MIDCEIFPLDKISVDIHDPCCHSLNNIDCQKLPPEIQPCEASFQRLFAIKCPAMRIHFLAKNYGTVWGYSVTFRFVCIRWQIFPILINFAQTILTSPLQAIKMPQIRSRDRRSKKDKALLVKCKLMLFDYRSKVSPKCDAHGRCMYRSNTENGGFKPADQKTIKGGFLMVFLNVIY